MKKPVIEIENISKKYKIGENIYGRGARTFRDLFDHKLKNLFNRNSKQKKDDNIIWALKNIDFEVEEGEVLGVIGKNGAGKSTLLKIISRITEPTTGKITLRGRVASLLEVGTGFNPELTGRENIYLNGAILGMRKFEINNKFDEIVEFAEVEKFIDTPVKRYSSGMYLRLAFAVAAHLEPEILIVDEVLAVGDAVFQKKCLGKMSDVSKSGRTVLFVSHNMAAIQQLCSRGIFLHNGQIKVIGDTNLAIEKYLSIKRSNNNSFERKGSGKVIFDDFFITDEHDNKIDSIFMGDDIYLNLILNFAENVKNPQLSIEFKNIMGESIAHIMNTDGDYDVKYSYCKQNIKIKIEKLSLTPGTYSISLWLGSYAEVYDYLEDCISFEIIQGDRINRLYPPHLKIYLNSVWN